MTLEQWLATAVADARRRGLHALAALLPALAASTEVLRGAAWNVDATDEPASPHAR